MRCQADDEPEVHASQHHGIQQLIQLIVLVAGYYNTVHSSYSMVHVPSLPISWYLPLPYCGQWTHEVN